MSISQKIDESFEEKVRHKRDTSECVCPAGKLLFEKKNWKIKKRPLSRILEKRLWIKKFDQKKVKCCKNDRVPYETCF